MKQGFSVWLDALRIIATLTVVASHVAYPRFTYGTYQWIRDLNLGSDAVILFFVISGLVIAKAAERDSTLPLYAFNRATRIYSVMIPALLLTWAFDHTGLAIDSSAYPAEFFEPLPLETFLWRGLTFSNEWIIADPVRLGSNGPLWSLSYEVAYYALFGVLVFLTGARRLVCAVLLALLVGPNVLLLIPAWLMGVWLWRLIRTDAGPRLSHRTVLILAILPPVLYGLALWLALPPFLQRLTEDLFSTAVPSLALRFSNEFLWNGLIGVLFTLHLFAMSRLLTDWRRGASAIRWCAQASFSVYVTHYPVLQLMDAILPADASGRALWLMLGALAVGLAFAQVFERPLDRWRQLLRPTQSVPG
jgi:peptidoglycan/LPS O-acetylase OafA/YrhL